MIGLLIASTTIAGAMLTPSAKPEVAVPQEPKRLALTDFLKIREANPKGKGFASAAEGASLKAVEIDSMVALTWDEQGLMDHISDIAKPPSKGQSDSLEDLLLALERTSQTLVQAQEADLAYRLEVVAVDPAALTQEKGGAKGQQALARLTEFRSSASASLKGQKGIAGQFLNDISASLKGPAGEGFKALDQSAADLARYVAGALNEKVEGAPAVRLYMHAYVETPYGNVKQVHVPGYDTLTGGKPVAFPRKRWALDKRTLSELAAAQQIFDSIKAYQEANFSEVAQQAQATTVAAFQKLAAKLSLDALDSQCNGLIERLRGETDGRCDSVLKGVRTVQALLRPLQNASIFKSNSQAKNLGALVALFDGLSKQLWTYIKDAPGVIGRLSKDISDLRKNYPELIDKTVEDYFTGIAHSYLEEFSELQETAIGWNDSLVALKNSLEIGSEFLKVGQDLVAKAIKPGEPMDTTLDMKTIGADRRPGDRLVITAEVRKVVPSSAAATKGSGADGQDANGGQGDSDPAEEEEVVLESGKQALFVEAYGGYWITSGGLLLVDPRSSVSRNINYDPRVGVGYHYHVGIKGSDFWNRSLNPGFGISMAMLDFDDDQRFEVGLAASMTLLNDTLWIGYGRNFQAKANYFYLGFNPYTITKLFGRR